MVDASEEGPRRAAMPPWLLSKEEMDRRERMLSPEGVIERLEKELAVARAEADRLLEITRKIEKGAIKQIERERAFSAGHTMVVKDRDRLREQMNAVYEERNLVVLLLARIARVVPAPWGAASSWVNTDASAPEGWRTTVFVELLGKQMSWHLPDSLRGVAMEALAGPWRVSQGWDGHTTEEKYKRVRALIREL